MIILVAIHSAEIVESRRILGLHQLTEECESLVRIPELISPRQLVAISQLIGRLLNGFAASFNCLVGLALQDQKTDTLALSLISEGLAAS